MNDKTKALIYTFISFLLAAICIFAILFPNVTYDLIGANWYNINGLLGIGAVSFPFLCINFLCKIIFFNYDRKNLLLPIAAFQKNIPTGYIFLLSIFEGLIVSTAVVLILLFSGSEQLKGDGVLIVIVNLMIILPPAVGLSIGAIAVAYSNRRKDPATWTPMFYFTVIYVTLAILITIGAIISKFI
jgi:hypothetical protein